MNYSIPESIHGNMYAFLDGFVIVVMYLSTDARLSVIQNLSRTSCILLTKDFKDLSKMVHTKDILCFLFLAIHVPNCFKHDIFVTVQNLTNIYIMMANFSMDIFYINCVCILKDCFKKMDESIRQLKKLRINDNMSTQTFMHHEQISPLVVMKLKNLEEEHLQISDGVELLNHTGFPANSKFWYKPYVTPAAFYFIKFWMMIWACETATNRARKMKTTLWDVFSATNDPFVKREIFKMFSRPRKPEPRTNKKLKSSSSCFRSYTSLISPSASINRLMGFLPYKLESSKLLELFSLQVLQKSNVFVMKGLIIDATLLTKMACGITTFLLILVQFLLVESC
uniref:uncharacterized protein LOC117166391 n=1 Tax=Bombus vancouverensis nearcticus TaxID=2705178 RepID=UPI00143C7192|nr:uncharacterized protein LOC117166391 [Bombus vancouverensis nearcticus]